MEAELSYIDQDILHALFAATEHDFRSYQPDAIASRLDDYCNKHHVKERQDLIPKILNEHSISETLINHLLLHVTRLFRDPWVWKFTTQKVLPLLSTYHRPVVWHAGCASGEEVFSLAILIQELGFLKRCTTFATDINAKILATAKKGRYRLKHLKQSEEDYQTAGGRSLFRHYYQYSRSRFELSSELVEQTLFATHDLTRDGVFCHANLVICRNVLIYFNPELREQVLQKLTDSLLPGGFLILGSSESLNRTKIDHLFTPIYRPYRIYQKKFE